MILSDEEIREAIEKGLIFVDPIPSEEQYTTSALDLLLHEEILELKTPQELQQQEPPGVQRPLIVDLSEVNVPDLLNRYAKAVQKNDDGSYDLPPNKFTLGITREIIRLPRRSKIAARVEGRSTLARMGLAVHLTAPTIHAGFSGRIVLEMYNFSYHTLRLQPGKLSICQLVFERLGKVPRGPVRTKFQDQRRIR